MAKDDLQELRAKVKAMRDEANREIRKAEQARRVKEANERRALRRATEHVFAIVKREVAKNIKAGNERVQVNITSDRTSRETQDGVVYHAYHGWQGEDLTVYVDTFDQDFLKRLCAGLAKQLDCALIYGHHVVYANAYNSSHFTFDFTESYSVEEWRPPSEDWYG